MKTYRAIKSKDGFKVIYAETMKKELSCLKNGEYTIEVKRKFKKASDLQFRWLYGSIYPQTLPLILDAGWELIAPTGGTILDAVDAFWKESILNIEITNRNTGEIIKLPVSKGKFNTLECMIFIDKIRDYCSEYFNTYIEEPDINWRQKKEQLQKEKDNE